VKRSRCFSWDRIGQIGKERTDAGVENDCAGCETQMRETCRESKLIEGRRKMKEKSG
jgi:hypothetical protein